MRRREPFVLEKFSPFSRRVSVTSAVYVGNRGQGSEEPLSGGIWHQVPIVARPWDEDTRVGALVQYQTLLARLLI